LLRSVYLVLRLFHGATGPPLWTQWFADTGLAGHIGVASVLALVVSPVVMLRKSLPKLIWTVYFTFVLLAVLLIFSSPQYRFYVYFTLFFLLLLLSLWLTSPKWIIRLHWTSMVAVAVLLMVPMSFGSLTANTFLSQNATFHFKDIFVPEPNSKWSAEFKGAGVGNMIYQTPVDGSFFWVTGNAKLPCVNEKQVEYFEHGFFYIPQQRSIELQDGFYSQ